MNPQTRNVRLHHQALPLLISAIFGCLVSLSALRLIHPAEAASSASCVGSTYTGTTTFNLDPMDGPTNWAISSCNFQNAQVQQLTGATASFSGWNVMISNSVVTGSFVFSTGAAAAWPAGSVITLSSNIFSSSVTFNPLLSGATAYLNDLTFQSSASLYITLAVNSRNAVMEVSRSTITSATANYMSIALTSCLNCELLLDGNVASSTVGSTVEISGGGNNTVVRLHNNVLNQPTYSRNALIVSNPLGGPVVLRKNIIGASASYIAVQITATALDVDEATKILSGKVVLYCRDFATANIDNPSGYDSALPRTKLMALTSHVKFIGWRPATFEMEQRGFDPATSDVIIYVTGYQGLNITNMTTGTFSLKIAVAKKVVNYISQLITTTTMAFDFLTNPSLPAELSYVPYSGFGAGIFVVNSTAVTTCTFSSSPPTWVGGDLVISVDGFIVGTDFIVESATFGPAQISIRRLSSTGNNGFKGKSLSNVVLSLTESNIGVVQFATAASILSNSTVYFENINSTTATASAFYFTANMVNFSKILVSRCRVSGAPNLALDWSVKGDGSSQSIFRNNNFTTSQSSQSIRIEDSHLDFDESNFLYGVYTGTVYIRCIGTQVTPATYPSYPNRNSSLYFVPGPGSVWYNYYGTSSYCSQYTIGGVNNTFRSTFQVIIENTPNSLVKIHNCMVGSTGGNAFSVGLLLSDNFTVSVENSTLSSFSFSGSSTTSLAGSNGYVNLRRNSISSTTVFDSKTNNTTYLMTNNSFANVVSLRGEHLGLRAYFDRNVNQGTVDGRMAMRSDFKCTEGCFISFSDNNLTTLTSSNVRLYSESGAFMSDDSQFVITNNLLNRVCVSFAHRGGYFSYDDKNWCFGGIGELEFLLNSTIAPEINIRPNVTHKEIMISRTGGGFIVSEPSPNLSLIDGMSYLPINKLSNEPERMKLNFVNFALTTGTLTIRGHAMDVLLRNANYSYLRINQLFSCNVTYENFAIRPTSSLIFSTIYNSILTIRNVTSNYTNMYEDRLIAFDTATYSNSSMQIRDSSFGMAYYHFIRVYPGADFIHNTRLSFLNITFRQQYSSGNPSLSITGTSSDWTGEVEFKKCSFRTSGGATDTATVLDYNLPVQSLKRGGLNLLWSDNLVGDVNATNGGGGILFFNIQNHPLKPVVFTNISCYRLSVIPYYTTGSSVTVKNSTIIESAYFQHEQSIDTKLYIYNVRSIRGVGAIEASGVNCHNTITEFVNISKIGGSGWSTALKFSGETSYFRSNMTYIVRNSELSTMTFENSFFNVTFLAENNTIGSPDGTMGTSYGLYCPNPRGRYMDIAFLSNRFVNYDYYTVPGYDSFKPINSLWRIIGNVMNGSVAYSTTVFASPNAYMLLRNNIVMGSGIGHRLYLTNGDIDMDNSNIFQNGRLSIIFNALQTVPLRLARPQNVYNLVDLTVEGTSNNTVDIELNSANVTNGISITQKSGPDPLYHGFAVRILNKTTATRCDVSSDGGYQMNVTVLDTLIPLFVFSSSATTYWATYHIENANNGGPLRIYLPVLRHSTFKILKNFFGATNTFDHNIYISTTWNSLNSQFYNGTLAIYNNTFDPNAGYPSSSYSSVRLIVDLLFNSRIIFHNNTVEANSRNGFYYSGNQSPFLDAEPGVNGWIDIRGNNFTGTGNMWLVYYPDQLYYDDSNTVDGKGTCGAIFHRPQLRDFLWNNNRFGSLEVEYRDATSGNVILTNNYQYPKTESTITCRNCSALTVNGTTFNHELSSFLFVSVTAGRNFNVYFNNQTFNGGLRFKSSSWNDAATSSVNAYVTNNSMWHQISDAYALSISDASFSNSTFLFENNNCTGNTAHGFGSLRLMSTNLTFRNNSYFRPNPTSTYSIFAFGWPSSNYGHRFNSTRFELLGNRLIGAYNLYIPSLNSGGWTDDNTIMILRNNLFQSMLFTGHRSVEAYPAFVVDHDDSNTYVGGYIYWYMYGTNTYGGKAIPFILNNATYTTDIRVYFYRRYLESPRALIANSSSSSYIRCGFGTSRNGVCEMYNASGLLGGFADDSNSSLFFIHDCNETGLRGRGVYLDMGSSTNASAIITNIYTHTGASSGDNYWNFDQSRNASVLAYNNTFTIAQTVYGYAVPLGTRVFWRDTPVPVGANITVIANSIAGFNFRQRFNASSFTFMYNTANTALGTRGIAIMQPAMSQCIFNVTDNYFALPGTSYRSAFYLTVDSGTLYYWSMVNTIITIARNVISIPAYSVNSPGGALSFELVGQVWINSSIVLRNNSVTSTATGSSLYFSANGQLAGQLQPSSNFEFDHDDSNRYYGVGSLYYHSAENQTLPVYFNQSTFVTLYLSFSGGARNQNVYFNNVTFSSISSSYIYWLVSYGSLVHFTNKSTISTRNFASGDSNRLLVHDSTLLTMEHHTVNPIPTNFYTEVINSSISNSFTYDSVQLNNSYTLIRGCNFISTGYIALSGIANNMTWIIVNNTHRSSNPMLYTDSATSFHHKNTIRVTDNIANNSVAGLVQTVDISASIDPKHNAKDNVLERKRLCYDGSNRIYKGRFQYISHVDTPKEPVTVNACYGITLLTLRGGKSRNLAFQVVDTIYVDASFTFETSVNSSLWIYESNSSGTTLLSAADGSTGATILVNQTTFDQISYTGHLKANNTVIRVTQSILNTVSPNNPFSSTEMDVDNNLIHQWLVNRAFVAGGSVTYTNSSLRFTNNTLISTMSNALVTFTSITMNSATIVFAGTQIFDYYGGAVYSFSLASSLRTSATAASFLDFRNNSYTNFMSNIGCSITVSNGFFVSFRHDEYNTYNNTNVCINLMNTSYPFYLNNSDVGAATITFQTFQDNLRVYITNVTYNVITSAFTHTTNNSMVLRNCANTSIWTNGYQFRGYLTVTTTNALGAGNSFLVYDSNFTVFNAQSLVANMTFIFQRCWISFVLGENSFILTSTSFTNTVLWWDQVHYIYPHGIGTASVVYLDSISLTNSTLSFTNCQWMKRHTASQYFFMFLNVYGDLSSLLYFRNNTLYSAQEMIGTSLFITTPTNLNSIRVDHDGSNVYTGRTVIAATVHPNSPKVIFNRISGVSIDVTVRGTHSTYLVSKSSFFSLPYYRSNFMAQSEIEDTQEFRGLDTQILDCNVTDGYTFTHNIQGGININTYVLNSIGSVTFQQTTNATDASTLQIANLTGSVIAIERIGAGDTAVSNNFSLLMTNVTVTGEVRMRYMYLINSNVRLKGVAGYNLFFDNDYLMHSRIVLNRANFTTRANSIGCLINLVTFYGSAHFLVIDSFLNSLHMVDTNTDKSKSLVVPFVHTWGSYAYPYPSMETLYLSPVSSISVFNITLRNSQIVTFSNQIALRLSGGKFADNTYFKYLNNSFTNLGTSSPQGLSFSAMSAINGSFYHDKLNVYTKYAGMSLIVKNDNETVPSKWHFYNSFFTSTIAVTSYANGTLFDFQNTSVGVSTLTASFNTYNEKLRIVDVPAITTLTVDSARTLQASEYGKTFLAVDTCVYISNASFDTFVLPEYANQTFMRMNFLARQIDFDRVNVRSATNSHFAITDSNCWDPAVSLPSMCVMIGTDTVNVPLVNTSVIIAKTFFGRIYHNEALGKVVVSATNANPIIGGSILLDSNHFDQRIGYVGRPGMYFCGGMLGTVVTLRRNYVETLSTSQTYGYEGGAHFALQTSQPYTSYTVNYEGTNRMHGATVKFIDPWITYGTLDIENTNFSQFRFALSNATIRVGTNVIGSSFVFESVVNHSTIYIENSTLNELTMSSTLTNVSLLMRNASARSITLTNLFANNTLLRFDDVIVTGLTRAIYATGATLTNVSVIMNNVNATASEPCSLLLSKVSKGTSVVIRNSSFSSSSTTSAMLIDKFFDSPSWDIANVEANMNYVTAQLLVHNSRFSAKTATSDVALQIILNTVNVPRTPAYIEFWANTILQGTTLFSFTDMPRFMSVIGNSFRVVPTLTITNTPSSLASYNQACNTMTTDSSAVVLSTTYIANLACTASTTVTRCPLNLEETIAVEPVTVSDDRLFSKSPSCGVLTNPIGGWNLTPEFDRDEVTVKVIGECQAPTITPVTKQSKTHSGSETSASRSDSETSASLSDSETSASLSDSETSASLSDSETSTSLSEAAAIPSDNETSASLTGSVTSASLSGSETSASLSEAAAIPSDNETSASLSGSETSASLSDNETSASLSRSETSASLSEAAAIPSDNETSASLSGSETSASLSEAAAIPSDNETSASLTGSETSASLSDNETSASLSDNETSASLSRSETSASLSEAAAIPSDNESSASLTGSETSASLSEAAAIPIPNDSPVHIQSASLRPSSESSSHTNTDVHDGGPVATYTNPGGGMTLTTFVTKRTLLGGTQTPTYEATESEVNCSVAAVCKVITVVINQNHSMSSCTEANQTGEIVTKATHYLPLSYSTRDAYYQDAIQASYRGPALLSDAYYYGSAVVTWPEGIANVTHVAAASPSVAACWVQSYNGTSAIIHMAAVVHNAPTSTTLESVPVALLQLTLSVSCGAANAASNYNWTLAFERPVVVSENIFIPEKAVKYANAATGVMAITVGAVAVPIASMQQGVAMALLRMAQCDEDALNGESLDVSVHPLQFGLGGGAGKYGRGALLGNLLVIPAIWCALMYLLVPFAIGALTGRTLDASRDFVGWPGMALMPLAVLSEGSAMASVGLLAQGGAGDIIMGLIGLSLLLVTTACWAAELWRMRRQVVLRRVSNVAGLVKAVHPRFEWEVGTSRGSFDKASYLDKRMQLVGSSWWLWSALAAHLLSLLVGVAEGLPVGPYGMCRARWAVASLAAILQAVVALTSTVPVELLLLGIIGVMSCILVLLIALSTFDIVSPGSTFSALNAVGMANSVLGVLLLGLGAFAAAYETIRKRSRRASEHSTPQMSLTSLMDGLSQESGNEGGAPSRYVGISTAVLNDIELKEAADGKLLSPFEL